MIITIHLIIICHHNKLMYSYCTLYPHDFIFYIEFCIPSYPLPALATTNLFSVPMNQAMFSFICLFCF